MKILVTGGAGYIGSFMTKTLLDREYDVVVLDSLERGDKSKVDKRAVLEVGDIRDIDFLESLFSSHKFDAIIHFAGYIAVGESEEFPDKYYENNVVGSRNLFATAIKHGTDKFIFSSSAAVYGNPISVPIPEDHPKNPTSVYGKNKLDVERILADLRRENPEIDFVCLRYFNASGGALDGTNGESHEPETHIIPLAIRAVLENKEFHLYGNDYDTTDGTCIRDYIHVLDLVDAHMLALDKLYFESGEYYYNVGVGAGYTNREVLEMVKEITKKDFKIVEEPRRKGDPDKLIADSSKISRELSFKPKHSDLKTIVESAWNWHEKQFKNQNS
ncbi:MAG TPA: UDP-glucose 4-epimerase GalE [Patescibacteria group bacterium]|nr:UDP-glucose 4-epimerase GalE [Patescibacteria group bacterium]